MTEENVKESGRQTLGVIRGRGWRCGSKQTSELCFEVTSLGGIVFLLLPLTEPLSLLGALTTDGTEYLCLMLVSPSRLKTPGCQILSFSQYSSFSTIPDTADTQTILLNDKLINE